MACKELKSIRVMANHSEHWYFTKEQIRNSPSVRDGIEHAKELGYRQQCANLIQDIGQRLQVNQLVINTAIVYMHRFYMLHSFNHFHRNTMAACFVFLAAKVEELPRKLEHILKASHVCLHKDEPQLDTKSDDYFKLSQDLVNNESILLQTLGFEVTVDHPNTYVVKCAQLVKASKELAQTAYFLATNSLHLTTFCIQYKPTVVACVCIYVSCLWANYNIPETAGRNWYEFIDNTANKKQLEELSSYFIKILDSCPTRLKKRLTSGGAVVYKEGKVIAKKETDTKTNGVNKHKPETSAEISKPNISSIPAKSHLKGLLKPQSHEATPPPSRPSSSCSNHSIDMNHTQVKKSHDVSYNSKHRPEHKKHEIKTENKNINSNHKQISHSSREQIGHGSREQKPSHNKTAEQLKLEQRKKWTPEQIEEYRKRKEREKMLHRKMLAENGSQEHKKHPSKPTTQNHPGKEHIFQSPGVVRKSSHPSTGAHESPMKKAKLESSNMKGGDIERKRKERIHPDVHHRSTLSSSGSDSDSQKLHKSHHQNNHNQNNSHHHKLQKLKQTLSPPPPPPPLFQGAIKPNDSKKITPISAPPPPPSFPKYVT